MKIMSWNILAPGLFYFFWSSCYGLDAVQDNEYYDCLDKKRFDNILSVLKKHAAEVICLQEVIREPVEYLDGKTIQQFIADELGYVLVSESFKNAKFFYYYPPDSQPKKGAVHKLTLDSGVATLVRPDLYAKNIATAETFGQSKIFEKPPGNVGSPFTIDRIGSDIYIVNVHMKMKHPNIAEPLAEFYDRVSSELSLSKLGSTVFVGDFNAGTTEAAEDLSKSKLYCELRDMVGHQSNNRVFIGNKLVNGSNVDHDREVEILTRGFHKNIKANNRLVSEQIVTSDHYPYIATIPSTLVGGGAIEKYLEIKERYLRLKKVSSEAKIIIC